MTKENSLGGAKFTIAHVASEVEPFSKTGGLGNVLGSLPKAQKDLGFNVIVVTPFYEKIIDTKLYKLESLGKPEKIEITEGVWENVLYRKGVLDNDVPIYFVEHKKFFGSQKKIYGAENDNARFMFFDVAALHLLKKLQYKPRVIHCHEWHTGLIPYFLKGRYKKDPFWKDTAVLYTIHNLMYQLGHSWWEIPQKLRDNGRSRLPSFTDTEERERINFTKRAILNADAINAVSETYREEIMTKNFGQELNHILKKRENVLFGIVNGIDYVDFNPLTDLGLAKHYSYKSVGLKKYNKKAVQRHYGLSINPETPLFCATSRITEQKGFMLLLKIFRILLKMDVQIIIMGDGPEEITLPLANLQKEYPKRFVLTAFDQEKETMLYAGSDMFLLPSRFEPCGINQMIALRYGCIPIVHHIGGLADTIIDYDPRTKMGNGFTFQRYGKMNLLIAIVRALETYKHKRAWRELVIFGLREANSWAIPALKYLDLYKTTIRLKNRAKRTK